MIARPSTGEEWPVSSVRCRFATTAITSFTSGRSSPFFITETEGRFSFRKRTSFSASKVGIQTTRPQPPFTEAIRSTAVALMPPTERFRSMPPKTSMPGTALRTSAAMEAVGSQWLFRTSARIPRSLARRARSMASIERGTESGSTWAWMSMTSRKVWPCAAPAARSAAVRCRVDLTVYIMAQRWTLAVVLAGIALGQAGERALFNGRDLVGWMWSTAAQPPAPSWAAVDGELRTTPGKGEGVYLLTRESFGDFDLSFEWNGEPGCNSGIKYRIQAYFVN